MYIHVLLDLRSQFLCTTPLDMTSSWCSLRLVLTFRCLQMDSADVMQMSDNIAIIVIINNQYP